MKTVLAAAAAVAALFATGCSAAGHPSWCHAAEHLDLAGPASVQNAIMDITAYWRPGWPAHSFDGLFAAEKANARLYATSSDTRYAIRQGTAAAAVLRGRCGYR